MRVGTFNFVVEASCDRKQPFWGGCREAAAGRRLETLRLGRRCIVHPTESRARTLQLDAFMSDSASAEEAGNVGGHAKRTVLIERRGDSISNAVVHERVAAADRRFAVAEHASEKAILEMGSP